MIKGRVLNFSRENVDLRSGWVWDTTLARDKSRLPLRNNLRNSRSIKKPSEQQDVVYAICCGLRFGCHKQSIINNFYLNLSLLWTFAKARDWLQTKCIKFVLLTRVYTPFEAGYQWVYAFECETQPFNYDFFFFSFHLLSKPFVCFE